jgi:hypothetical protein
MRRCVAVGSLLFLFAPSNLAPESRCNQRFAITPVDRHQWEWYSAKGVKKYPGVCIDDQNPVYLLKWETWDVRHSKEVPKVRSATTTTQGPSGPVGTPAMRGGVPISATPTGPTTTTSTTTWVEHRKETFVDWHVRLTVFRGGRAVFTTHRLGKWVWSKPTKDAFEDALKFISKQRD